MTEKSWRRRAANMRLWATEVRDPYTRIEMMALAEAYELTAAQPSNEMTGKAVMASKLSRARCGRRIEPEWRFGAGRGLPDRPH